jgi:hypothetical protein
MQRREFITLLGGAAVTGTSAARAQQARLPVIGYLSGWSPNDAPEYLNYFRQGLAETGYVEGRNVAIEYRYAAGRFEEVAKLVDLDCEQGLFGHSPWLAAVRLFRLLALMSASLIGRLGSSAFRLSTTAVSKSLAGSRFSSESAPRPFHHGVRRRGGTIFRAALPSD